LTPEQKLRQLKIELAPATPPVANYVNAVRAGNLLFLAGKGPDLFVEVFGSRGKHARSAVGMGSLPNNIPVEIECIVEIGDGKRGQDRSGPFSEKEERAAKRVLTS